MCGSVVHAPVLTFIRLASSQIRSLEINSFVQLEALLRDWDPHFPMLQEIAISIPEFTVQDPYGLKEVLRRLLNDAPNSQAPKNLFNISP